MSMGFGTSDIEFYDDLADDSIDETYNWDVTLVDGNGDAVATEDNGVIHCYADSAASAATSVKLETKRSLKGRRFLVSCGFDMHESDTSISNSLTFKITNGAASSATIYTQTTPNLDNRQAGGSLFLKFWHVGSTLYWEGYESDHNNATPVDARFTTVSGNQDVSAWASVILEWSANGNSGASASYTDELAFCVHPIILY